MAGRPTGKLANGTLRVVFLTAILAHCRISFQVGAQASLANSGI
jgi:hypothetical protein